MYRRIAALLLGVLVVLPVVAPATASEPSASPSSPPTETPAAKPLQVVAPTASGGPSVLPNATKEPAPSEPEVDLPAVASPDSAPAGALDATGRYIVVLRDGTNTAAVVDKVRKRDGVKADRTFGKTIRGFSAKLDKQQKRDLLADPNVAALVPDEVIHLTAQSVPTGVSRVGGRQNTIAAIDGSDRRVDADVAIVDTGIGSHPDLNVAGGYNCSSSDRTAWRDKNNHGTHVAGTVAALDNGIGVVGIAPGARVWGVKILNDNGFGYISWYICGLDWILAQHDPADPTRPLFEAVNMSVTKYGSDDHNCGYTTKDLLHRAICRVVAGGITVVAAAANDSHNAAHNIPASYNEVITVSALADTDGKAGGLGGNRCYSWGGYDKDDTFADFSNYGGDVDIMAPGKCIMSTIPGPSYTYMSGTSMAAPTVTGAVALYKSSRPYAKPAEVREALRYLGNLNWKVSTDPDSTHEPLLDVSRIGSLGTFALAPAAATNPTGEGGTSLAVPFTVRRSATFFERVQLSITSLPAGWTGALKTTSLMGWTATADQVNVTIPRDTPPGTYDIALRGTNQRRTVEATIPVTVVEDDPTASPPTITSVPTGTTLGRTTTRIGVTWPAATDPTTAIAGYQLQRSVNVGAWGATRSFPAATRAFVDTILLDAIYRYRVRAIDAVGHWSPWAEMTSSGRYHAYDDRSTHVLRAGSWQKLATSAAFKGTLLGSSSASAKLSLTFTGRSLAIVTPKGPKRGSITISIDGVVQKVVSLKASTATSRNVVFAWYSPTRGTHTVTVSPTGTGTYRAIRIDAFVVGR
ncbi:MAG: S8 family serine peptidase [Chloroflexota bacterium]